MGRKKAVTDPAAPPAKRGRKAKAVSADGTPALPPTLTTEQSAKLAELWAIRQRVALEAQPLVDAEMALRKELTDSLMPQPVEGTHTFELGNGYKLKLQASFSRSIDDTQFASVFGRLPAGTDKKVLRWIPGLNKKGYDDLPAAERAIFDECVSLKLGAPQLSIEAPKPPAE